MDVKVASKVGHALTRSLGGLSLADGSMLLRLRRASIALLGLVGAVGLGLVFFISQIGWPGVLSGPLPGTPTRVGTVHDAIALTAPGPGDCHREARGRRPRPGRRRGAARPGVLARLPPRQRQAACRRAGRASGSRHRAARPLGARHRAGTSGSGTGTFRDPHGCELAAAEPSEPVKTSSDSKASEAAVAKAVSDSSKSAAATATKSQGQKSAKDQSSSSGSSKSSEASSAKAHRDEASPKPKRKRHRP